MSFFSRAAAQTLLAAPPSINDLILPTTGEFRVSGNGIVTRLNAPLSRLSGHYPWQLFPVGVAALKLLVADMYADDSDSFVCRLLTDDEQEQLACKIGRVDVAGNYVDHDSDFCGDVDRLIQWSSDLAIRCPYASAARDLQRLPHMPGAELERYVRPMLSTMLQS